MPSFVCVLVRVLLVLAAGLVWAPARATEFARYYEYVFFVPGSPTQDLAAQARAALPSPLQHHRLVEPAALLRWDGKGQTPLALERRSMPLPEVRLNQLGETGEPLAQVLRMPPLDTVAMLVVMVGVPAQPDVPAYIEALAASVAIGKALRSPVFADIETGDLRRIDNLEARLREGLRGGRWPLSPTNPPRLTALGGITEFEDLPDDGLRTHGLRKLGLPDIALERGTPGLAPAWLLAAAGNLLLAGKVPPTPGTVMTLHTEAREVAAELRGAARPNATAQLRLARSALQPGPVLRLEIEGPADVHEYERQMLFFGALTKPRHADLGEGQEQALLRAIARARLHTRELRDKLDELRAAGTRVFFAYRTEKLLMRLRMIEWGPPPQTVWHEFVQWTEDGRMRTHRWKGDPRSGGTAERLPRPATVNGRSSEFFEAELSEGEVDDVLVVNARGQAKGGEVVALIGQMAAETPSRQRR
jgi:hypothetical protein